MFDVISRVHGTPQAVSTNNVLEIKTPSILGRDDFCAIQIKNILINGKHAAITPTGNGQWKLTALGTTAIDIRTTNSGTIPLTVGKEHILRPGDTIILLKDIVEFAVLQEKGAAGASQQNQTSPLIVRYTTFTPAQGIVHLGSNVQPWGQGNYLLITGTCTIGRAETNNIVVADPTVSALHCRLERVNSHTWRLTHLGSNPLLFQPAGLPAIWMRKDDPRQLGPGDSIMLGNRTMTFDVQSGSVPTAQENKPGSLPLPAENKPEPQLTYHYDGNLIQRMSSQFFALENLVIAMQGTKDATTIVHAMNNLGDQLMQELILLFPSLRLGKGKYRSPTVVGCFSGIAPRVRMITEEWKLLLNLVENHRLGHAVPSAAIVQEAEKLCKLLLDVSVCQNDYARAR